MQSALAAGVTEQTDYEIAALARFHNSVSQPF